MPAVVGLGLQVLGLRDIALGGSEGRGGLAFVVREGLDEDPLVEVELPGLGNLVLQDYDVLERLVAADRRLPQLHQQLRTPRLPL